MAVKIFWLNVSFSIAYFSVTCVTLFIVQSDGYISPIWPAAGVALTAVILYGYRLLPAVMVGSLTVNFFLTDIQYPIVNIVFIALTVTLQAALGRYLLFKKHNFSIHLTNKNDVFWFIFTMVISTLSAATLSCFSLWFTGHMALTKIPMNWLTWWLGDSFGVVLICPMLISILLYKQPQWRKRVYIVNISFSLMLLFTLATYSFSRNHEILRLTNLIEQQFISVHRAVSYYIDSHINTLNAITSIMAVDNPIDSPLFENYMRNNMVKNPAFTAISWNRIVSKQNLNNYIKIQQSLKGPNFKIIVKENLNMHVIIEAIYPLASNASALGIDVYQQPLKRLAIDRALKNKTFSATTEVTLAQAEKDTLIMLLFMPYFNNQNLIGFITGVLDINRFMTTAFSQLNLRDLHIQLARLNNKGHTESILYDSEQALTLISMDSITHVMPKDMRRIMNFNIGDQKVSLLVEPTNQWLVKSGVKQYWLILIPCLFLMAIIGGLVLIITGDHYIIGELALTKDIQNKKLLATNTELNVVLNRLTDTQKKLVEKEKFSALGHLVAGVAHEINTPTGIIITAVSLLQDHVTELLSDISENKLQKSTLLSKLNKIQEVALLINNNSNRSATLISRFKQLAISTETEERVRFSLKTFLSELANSLKSIIHPHKLTLQCDEFSIDSYQAIISFIFQYLITNSVEHGFVNLAQGEITITISQTNNAILIKYSDNGIGMDKELVKNIFVPFYTTKRNIGATGLGGAIFFNVISQILNGTVECTSEFNLGIRMDINLPLPNDSIKLLDKST